MKTEQAGSTMRLAPVILPDLGTGPDLPIVISYWFASRGELVWEGERLVEVLAGPATFDVPAPVTGRLAEIRGREDDRVEPGSVLGLVATTEEEADPAGPADGLEDGQDGPIDRAGGDPQPRRPTT
jgi:pyruvate/2-oxoglutarate dehydrogenase complex dihydrolipoamide acyltransferase (E2) component